MLEVKLVSSLDKVGVEQELLELDGKVPLYVHRGETISFQIAYRDASLKNDESVICCIDSSAIEGEAIELRIRRVLNVMCRRSCDPDSKDEDYLFYEARMAPDLLRDLAPGEGFPVKKEWQSLWVDAGPKEGQAPGSCRIRFQMKKCGNRTAEPAGKDLKRSTSAETIVNVGKRIAQVMIDAGSQKEADTVEKDGAKGAAKDAVEKDGAKDAVEKDGAKDAAKDAAEKDNAEKDGAKKGNAEKDAAAKDGGMASVTVTIRMTDQTLPKLDIPHTEWFHYDGIADYYGVEVFSEEFWRIFRNFLEIYVKRGGNTILVPVLTPPLDTAAGGERTTVQLAEVEIAEGEYRLDFANMERFLDICLDAGIEYFEICHLFTQWGAAAAPKVAALVDGKREKIFGWETPSDSPEYLRFLSALLPAVKELMERRGLLERTFFHISDEPDLNTPRYRRSQSTVRELLKGCTILEAVSDYEYYEKGLVDIPVCATNYIAPFLEKRPPKLWCYYCCAQTREVPNRFISMPSRRNRIYGVLLYWHHMDGFLHWGFNFYNSGLSKKKIDPYETPDADNFFPAGDPFLIYPGADGIPEESIRIMVQKEAVDDYRALRLLESRIGRERVMELIRREAGMELSFRQYPRNKEFLLNLREKVDRMLMGGVV